MNLGAGDRYSMWAGEISLNLTQLSYVRKQVAMATAQVLLHRFWYVTSMKQFGMAVSEPYMFEQFE